MDAEGVAEKDRPDIIPKIEKSAALRNIDGILELSGGLMVARRPRRRARSTACRSRRSS